MIWRTRFHGTGRLRNVSGFTLLEVMVALAILAITLTSIYQLHSQTLMMSATARFYNQAPALATARLAEIERRGISEGNDGSGDFGQSYPGYAWTSTFENVASDLVENGSYQLTRIDITVAYNDELTYHLRTYRFHGK